MRNYHEFYVSVQCSILFRDNPKDTKQVNKFTVWYSTYLICEATIHMYCPEG